MSVTPTETERLTAMLVVSRLPISLGDYRTRDLDAAADVIAQALADQRARYEAVADWEMELAHREFEQRGETESFPAQCLIAAARLLDRLGVPSDAGEEPVWIAARALQSYAKQANR